MPNHARTHDENRNILCLLCFGKSKDMRQITNENRELIERYFIHGYDPDDYRLPSAICSTCRRVLNDYKAGNFTRRIIMFDHSKLASTRPLRSKFHDKCDCLICEAASFTSKTFSSTSPIQQRHPGRPANPHSSTYNSREVPESLKLCSKCLTQLRRGCEHNCTKLQRHENLCGLACSGPINSDEKLASSLIKRAAVEQGESVSLSQISGKALKVDVSPFRKSQQKETVLSAGDFSEIQSDLHLSSHQTVKLASHLRASTANRKIVEPNLKGKLSEIGHTLDSFFDVLTLNYHGNEDAIFSRPTVFCSNITELISFVEQKRSYYGEANIKIGVDGGGGFLKVSLTVSSDHQTGSSPTPNQRLHHGSSAPSSSFKDTSVNRIFIIAIAPDVPENYFNVLQIWVMLKLKRLEIPHITYALDLKLTNIMLGLGSHASTYPCSWCKAEKRNLSKKGELRTFESIHENFWMWRGEGAQKTTAKNFFNCVHAPILFGEMEDNIIDVVPPPELHLLTGAVNTIYDHMAKEWPHCSCWSEACHVSKNPQHGGAFNGNACRKLLHNVDMLRSECPLAILKYVDTFSALNDVVHSCFGNFLHDNYVQCISAFKKSYMSLAIPVTPKVHTIFFHIIDFCSKRNRSLGYFSEQASESLHSNFLPTWERYKVSQNHPMYSQKLLRAVCEYNSRHL